MLAMSTTGTVMSSEQSTTPYQSKIYTRKGDDGTTTIGCNLQRVSKGSPRVEILGRLDELQAAIGALKCGITMTINKSGEIPIWGVFMNNIYIIGVITGCVRLLMSGFTAAVMLGPIAAIVPVVVWGWYIDTCRSSDDMKFYNAIVEVTGEFCEQMHKIMAIVSADGIASTDDTNDKSSDELSIDNEDIVDLEKLIDTLESTLPPLSNFIMYFNNVNAVLANCARVQCRRAERSLVANGYSGSNVQKYINRLSDTLFVLARKIDNIESGEAEATVSKHAYAVDDADDSDDSDDDCGDDCAECKANAENTEDNKDTEDAEDHEDTKDNEDTKEMSVVSENEPVNASNASVYVGANAANMAPLSETESNTGTKSPNYDDTDWLSVDIDKKDK